MNPKRVVAFTAIVLSGAILYGLLVGYAPVLDRLTLFPPSYRVNPSGATRGTIPFRNGELEIWTARSRIANALGAPKAFLLRFYGNADRADLWVASEADMFAGHALEIWGMNYPGFGGSTGPARLAAIGPASLAAYDELQKIAGQRPIYVFGTSMGTTAALHVAAQRPIAGLILHNPPPLRQMILQQFGWWNLWLLAGPLSRKVPPDLDSLTNANASHAPAIFLLAENDEVVAPRFQRMVANAYAGPKREIILQGGTHNSPLTEADWTKFRAALAWLMPDE